MEIVVFERGAGQLRWLHVIAGMAWIGSSFFFMHLDAGSRPHPEITPDERAVPALLATRPREARTP